MTCFCLKYNRDQSGGFPLCSKQPCSVFVALNANELLVILPLSCVGCADRQPISVNLEETWLLVITQLYKLEPESVPEEKDTPKTSHMMVMCV